jgi:glycosyltransferase involved in cell wall biosynthesis
MRALYLVYGAQSGVIKSLVLGLQKKGQEIDIYDAAAFLNYRNQHFPFPFPNFRPCIIINFFIALFQFKNNWKRYFKRTTYAFRLMTGISQDYIEKNKHNYSFILQSGGIFCASFNKPPLPYYLYIDHVYQISKQYPLVPQVKDSDTCCAAKSWEELEAKVYLYADRIFTMSNFVKNALMKFYNIAEDKIAVVGAGPNFANLPQLKERRYDAKTVLFVGKDFYRKGGETMLRAFKIVRKEIPQARLFIAGDPKEKLHIAEAGVENKGLLSSKEVEKLYLEASVFALPTPREAFGLAYLEAMAYKLPCIGTKVEAIPEIIEDGYTGFLVEKYDVEALAQKLILLLEDINLAKLMGERGYEKVRNNFTWDIVAERILKDVKINPK